MQSFFALVDAACKLANLLNATPVKYRSMGSHSDPNEPFGRPRLLMVPDLPLAWSSHAHFAAGMLSAGFWTLAFGSNAQRQTGTLYVPSFGLFLFT